jgi:putative membrane protein
MFTTLIAHHGYGGWGYGPGPWFLLFPLFWIGVLAFVLWRFRRAGGPPWGGWRGAQSVLAERYARGDIGADEYRERLSVLKEDQR